MTTVSEPCHFLRIALFICPLLFQQLLNLSAIFLFPCKINAIQTSLGTCSLSGNGN